MNSEENPADPGTKEWDQASNPLNQTAKSSMILENMPESQGDVMSVESIQADLGSLRLEDATESKLDDKMDQLLKILDETINILGADVDEDDDSGYYILSDQNVKNEDRNVQNEALLDDDKMTTREKENVPNNGAVGRESEAEDFSVTKNPKGKCSGLHEFTDSFMIALMLFTLCFLLSSLI